MPKIVKLLSLSMRNFKGVKEKTVMLNGESVFVYGTNGTCKTTLADGYRWLLFGKDNEEKADFCIKPLDENNNVIHGLDVEVEATLDINGERVTFKKVQREDWSTKTSAAKPELKGHTIDYFINDVPKRKRDYEAKLAEIAPIDVLKIITSLTYFNTQLKTMERRKYLVDICGDITDEDVIAAYPPLGELPKIIGNRKPEEHKEMVQVQIKKIDKELDALPTRMDEATRNMPDVSDIDPEYVIRQSSLIEEKIRKQQEKLIRLQSGGEIAHKEKALRELQSDMLEMKNNLQAEKMDKIAQAGIRVAELKNQLSEIKQNIQDKIRTINRGKEILAEYQTEFNHLSQEFNQLNNQTFEFEQKNVCPTCGQQMPFEKLERARREAEAEFNRKKANRLEEIRNKAIAVAQKGKELRNELTGHVAEAKRLKEEQAKKEAELREAEQQLLKLKNSLKDEEISSEYVQKRTQEVALKQEIARLREASAEAIQKIEDEISRLRQVASELETDKAKLELAKKTEERINELKAREKQLYAEKEQLEGELFLINEFNRVKANMLEEKVNSKFRIAKFKMFNRLLNGSIEETCEALVNGVPYGRGLNKAAMANVDLDIVSTLSEHYGVIAPVFIDNREGIIDLVDVDNQIINLVVSKKDKQLRIEKKEIFEEVV